MEGIFLFIVNSGEHRQASVQSFHLYSLHPPGQSAPYQAIDIELCTDEGGECSNKDDAPFGHTACRQEQTFQMAKISDICKH